MGLTAVDELSKARSNPCDSIVIRIMTAWTYPESSRFETVVLDGRPLSAQQQAQEVHLAASALGAQPLPPAAALVDGSHRLRTAFLAAIFRARHGLVPDAASLQELREGALSVRDSTSVAMRFCANVGRFHERAA